MFTLINVIIAKTASFKPISNSNRLNFKSARHRYIPYLLFPPLRLIQLFCVAPVSFRNRSADVWRD